MKPNGVDKQFPPEETQPRNRDRNGLCNTRYKIQAIDIFIYIIILYLRRKQSSKFIVKN